MCGRYTLKTTADELQREFELDQPPEGLLARYNIAPTQELPIVVGSSMRKLGLARWGLVPSWAKDARIGNKMINARAETLEEKPSYRQALASRRCLVPADGFYEWRTGAEGKKEPIYIRRQSGGPLAFAGLWERWHPREGGAPLLTFTIVTTAANPLMEQFHQRMPVILPRREYGTWLAAGSLDDAQLERLLVPYAADDFEAFPVSSRVNSPKNDGPECLAPPG